MYGWLIILIVAAIAFVGLTIWVCVDPYLDAIFPIWLLLTIVVIILSVVNIAVFIDGKNFAKQVECQQEIFDKSISGSDKGYDYAITKKVIDINQKIYAARNSKELWGNWSSCYYVSDDVLVPITLNKADSTEVK